MTKLQQRAFMIFAIVFAGGMMLAVCMIWSQLSSRQRDIDKFSQLQQLVMQTTSAHTSQTPPVQTDKTENPNTGGAQSEVQPSESQQNQVLQDSNGAAAQEGSSAMQTMAANSKRNLAVLMEQNQDCLGWMYIEGAGVDYPVMYIRRGFDKSYSHSGVPFMDWRCTPDSDNRIIYGHNMKNNTMFSGLVNYTDKLHCMAYPIIEFETSEGCESCEVFAVIRTDSSDQWYLFVDAQDQEEYDRYVSYIKSRSLYDTGVTPQFGQKLLTLSTCEYTSDDARLLVIAAQKGG